MKQYTVECTVEQWSTINTSLRLELERNWGGDKHVVKLLKDALAAVYEAQERFYKGNKR